ncbi:hypothetical protein DFS34DRAFT_671926 [Phlyctochytrium arcticum]|nr:hypothetical protein DFS34DRAFT_671926 [Phlyctochytrium arcticum]
MRMLETTVLDGTVNVSLEIDDNRLRVNDLNQLTTTNLDVIVLLHFSNEQNWMSLKYDDSSLYVNEEEKLAVIERPINVDSPLFIYDDDKIELRYASHFNDDEGLFDIDGSIFKKGLSLKISDPLYFDGFNSHKLSLSIDSSLEIDDGELKVKEKDYEFPLYRDDGTVGIAYKTPLYVSEDGLTLNAASPLGTNDVGALDLKIGDNLELKDGKLKAKKQEASDTLKGAGAISVYKDITEFTDGSLVKLSVDHSVFQQTNNVLSIRSVGLGQVPFDNGLSGLNRNGDFTYSETLNELHVPHVVLSHNLSPDNDEAVTSSYVDQLYQSGSGVDILAKVNSRREISIRTDASLSRDVNQNLSVNPSAFVNNQSVRVDSNGKLTSGLLFQSMNNLGIRNGNEVYLDLKTQGNLEFDGSVLIDSRTFGNGLHENSSHEVSLDLTVEGALSMNSTKTHITENLTASNGVARVGNDIRGSTISCTLELPEQEVEQPYVGGNGITVAGKTISNNMTLTAGNGVILVGSPGIGYTISTIETFQQKKAAEDPAENKTSDTPQETLKGGSGSTIASSGGLAGGLAGGIAGVISIFGGGAGLSGVASSAIGAVGGLSGAVTGGGLAGGFISIFGYERKQKKDENDNSLYNEDGTASLEEGSNVIIATLPDALGCNTTRLLFDKPPLCSWLGIENEYGQQAVNLQILREYDNEVILPKIVDTTSSLVLPLQDSIDLNTALITGLEEDIFSSYQAKITSENKLSYDLLQNSPNLSGFATISNIASTYVSNSSLSTTLSGYVNNSALVTVLATKQPLITSSSKLDYALLSNVPNLALKQDVINSSAKLPYSLINGTPDLSPYLTRTTDLSSINSLIATKVSQSIYDTRQTAIDTSIGLQQNLIQDYLSLSAVDTVSTPLLTDTFTITPTGTLSGTATYDNTNTVTTLVFIPRTELTKRSLHHCPETFLQCGGFAAAKYLDNLSLVQDSDATQSIRFTPPNGKVTSQISTLDDGNYGSSMILSSSTTSSGSLQELMRLGTNAVTVSKKFYAVDDIFTKTLKVATESYVSTSISAIPLSNYTLLSTFNTRSTTLDNRFTPIESRQALFKALSNKDTIDLSSGDVVNILPISKLDTTTLQPLITSASAASIKTILGLSSTASSGTIEYANILNKPSFGSLALKNTVDLSTSDICGILPIGNVNVSTLQPLNITLTTLSSSNMLIFGTNIAPPTLTPRSIGTKIVRYPNSGGLQDSAIGIQNAAMWFTFPDNTVSQTFKFYGGTTPAVDIYGNGRIVSYGTEDASSLITGALQVKGGASITKKLYVGSDLFVGGNSPYINITGNGENGNAVGINLNTWATRPGGIQAKIMAIDNGTGGAKLSFQTTLLDTGSPIEILSGSTNSVTIPITTNSTSATSCALNVAGGVGIGKFLTIGGGGAGDGPNTSGGITLAYFGGGYHHFIRSRHNGAGSFLNAIDFYLNISWTSNGSSAPTIGNINAFTIDSTTTFCLQTTDAAGVDSGALRVSGGASIAKKLYVGTEIYFSGNSITTSLAGKQPIHANLTNLSTTTPTLPKLVVNESIDVGSTSTSQHMIQNSSTSDVLKIKNRANNGYASIMFESGTNVQASTGVRGSTVPNATTDRLYLKSPSIYLDAQDISYPGGFLTTTLGKTVFDNLTVSASNSVTFTTQISFEMFTGCVSAFATTTQQGKTFLCKIDGVTVKSLYFFFNQANIHTRLPFSFVCTTLNPGIHGFQIIASGNVFIDENSRTDLCFIEW